MRNLFTSFAKDESGATAIEYGLIAALLSVAIIAAITSVKEAEHHVHQHRYGSR